MKIEFCWEDSETGCICGNECEPPMWMVDMWNAEERRREQYVHPCPDCNGNTFNHQEGCING